MINQGKENERNFFKKVYLISYFIFIYEIVVKYNYNVVLTKFKLLLKDCRFDIVVKRNLLQICLNLKIGILKSIINDKQEN